MKALKTIIALVALTTVLAGCSAITEDIKNNVSYQIESVDVEIGMRDTGGILPTIAADIAINVRMLNESRIDLTLTTIDYQVFAGNTQIADGTMGSPVTIKARGGEERVQLFAQVSGRALLNEGINLTRNRSLPPIRIVGKGHVTTAFGKHEIPFTLHYNENDSEI